MQIVDTATARKRLADLVNRVLYTKERITLTRYGKACAVLVPVEEAAAEIAESPVKSTVEKPPARRRKRPSGGSKSATGREG